MSHDADDAVRQLAAALFAEPERLVSTVTHPITETWTIAPHRHKRVLQLDVMDHCRGRAKASRRWHTLGERAALATPRGAEHGYELQPAGDDQPIARVYHVRIEPPDDWVPPSWPAVADSGEVSDALLSAMRVVVRLGAAGGRPPLLITRLVEALCLWPTGTAAAADFDDRPEDELRGLDAAIELIEKSLDAPPSLDELAAIAHFSPRHFARRFRQAYGCTPHDYITAQRLALARQFLSTERLTIARIADRLGFASPATFSRWFRQHAGLPPSQFRSDPGMM